MTIPFEERDRSIPGIVIDLLNQFTTLLRQESQLARAEISENVNRAIMGIVMAVVAAVVFIPALVILLMAAVYALEATGLAPHWSALAIGGGALIVGAPSLRVFALILLAPAAVRCTLERSARVKRA